MTASVTQLRAAGSAIVSIYHVFIRRSLLRFGLGFCVASYNVPPSGVHVTCIYPVLNLACG